MTEASPISERKCVACKTRDVAVDGDLCGLCNMKLECGLYASERRIIYLVAGTLGVVLGIITILIWWL